MKSFTKIPNFMFDIMRDMDLLENKFLLFIFRYTLGYQRLYWNTTIKEIVQITNISKPSVYKSIEILTNLSIIKTINNGKNIKIFLNIN